MAIHANWHLASLLLWENASAKKGGNLADLRDFVGEISSDALLASVAQETSISLWLPSEASRPSTAPPDVVISGDQSASADSPLAVFELPALRFSPAEAIDLLLSLPEPLPPSCGDSMRYWSILSQFVIHGIRRQAFFPSIMQAGQKFEAIWRPLLSDRLEIERLEDFAGAMPPSCRAVVESNVAEPLNLVESFLTETTDALIRRAVSNDPFFNRVHGPAALPAAEPEMRWLSALLAEDRTVRGDVIENARLAEQVRLWTARLDETTLGMKWRLGFSLIEPRNDDETPTKEGETAPAAMTENSWHVIFQLYPQDEDEEPIDASEIWDNAGGSLDLFGRKITEQRELLVSELQRAAEVFPPLTRVIESAAPSQVELSTAEAHLFLRQWAADLKDRSFIVVMPDWTDQRERRLELVMSVRPVEEWHESGRPAGHGAGPAGSAFEISAGRMGLDSLLYFDWRIAVGGLELSPREFQILIERQSPLIQFRGRWIEIDLEAAKATAELMRRKPSGNITLGEAFGTAYGFTRDNATAPLVSLSGTSWIQQLLEQSPAAQVENLAQPPSFGGTLRAYQLRGLQWLWFLNQLGIGGCLADDMGLGKTIQLIALLLHEREAGSRVGPTLLFAPTSVVGNWVKELERFAPSLRVLLHQGPQRLRGEAFSSAAAEYHVVIASYALAQRDLEDLRRVAWHRIVLDEAQKIKNPSAASSLAIRSLSAPHRVALTGTPIENHLSELWSIMDMLNPGLLGSARDFRERFAVPIEKLADQDRAQHLRKMIRPFLLRRTKTDPELIGDLPEKMEMKVFCTLTAEQAAMYERVTAEMLGLIDSATGIRRRGLILAVLTRLKQICDHPNLLLKEDTALDGRSGKCERLVEMLEEVLEEGESALVFTQYRQMGHLLEKILTGRLHTPVQFLHGGTPQKQREGMIERFQSPGSDTRIFLLSLRAGGLGLNLTAANHVFHFDRWWNPAVEAQATDRVHRIGQTRRVQVHKFISMGTVEERIDRLLSEKIHLAENIVGGGDEWLTDLSTAELRDYLKLSEQAVGEF